MRLAHFSRSNLNSVMEFWSSEGLSGFFGNDVQAYQQIHMRCA